MPTSANDNQPRKIPPIITRLRRAGRHTDIAALATLAIPAAPPPAANDDELADGFGIDTIFEIRPTPDEMAAAGTDGVHRDKRGHVTAWRVVDDDGKERWFRAREGYRQSKGTRRKSLKVLAQDSARHLSLRGAVSFPDLSVPHTSYASFGEFFERVASAYDILLQMGIPSRARQFLAEQFVDGTLTLEQAAAANPQASVTRGPKAVARGATFLAGGVALNETASPGSFVGAPDAAENAMIANIDAPSVEAALGKHADVLRDSLDGMSAREIAARRGWGKSKAAEQRAVRAQDRALAALAEVQRKAS